eukprot:GHVQ01029634.1.p1 GENE.GHVQ01029634.1~~GHVQ01029634.1.p1  ORF type:complete len:570 (-),score=76.15 GHVQ01029634.1:1696-3405(-)
MAFDSVGCSVGQWTKYGLGAQILSPSSLSEGGPIPLTGPSSERLDVLHIAKVPFRLCRTNSPACSIPPHLVMKVGDVTQNYGIVKCSVGTSALRRNRCPIVVRLFSSTVEQCGALVVTVGPQTTVHCLVEYISRHYARQLSKLGISPPPSAPSSPTHRSLHPSGRMTRTEPQEATAAAFSSLYAPSGLETFSCGDLRLWGWLPGAAIAGGKSAILGAAAAPYGKDILEGRGTYRKSSGAIAFEIESGNTDMPPVLCLTDSESQMMPVSGDDDPSSNNESKKDEYDGTELSTTGTLGVTDTPVNNPVSSTLSSSPSVVSTETLSADPLCGLLTATPGGPRGPPSPRPPHSSVLPVPLTGLSNIAPVFTVLSPNCRLADTVVYSNRNAKIINNCESNKGETVVGEEVTNGGAKRRVGPIEEDATTSAALRKIEETDSICGVLDAVSLFGFSFRLESGFDKLTAHQVALGNLREKVIYQSHGGPPFLVAVSPSMSGAEIKEKIRRTLELSKPNFQQWKLYLIENNRKSFVRSNDIVDFTNNRIIGLLAEHPHPYESSSPRTSSGRHKNLQIG